MRRGRHAKAVRRTEFRRGIQEEERGGGEGKAARARGVAWRGGGSFCSLSALTTTLQCLRKRGVSHNFTYGTLIKIEVDTNNMSTNFFL